MSNNCLNIRTIGSVEPLLPMVGEKDFQLDFTQNRETPIHLDVTYISGSGQHTIKLSGSAYFTNSTGTENLGQNLTIDANTETDIYIIDSASEIATMIMNVYDLYRFSEMSTNDDRINSDLTNFKYTSDLMRIDLNMFDIIDSISNNILSDDLRIMYFLYGDGSGAISTEELGAYLEARDFRLAGIVVTGDIINLYTLTKLTTLRINGANLSQVTGEINEFIQKMIDDGGRTSGTIAMRFLTDGNITLNGSALANTNVSVTITSSIQYSVTCNSVTYTYVKSGGEWTIQI